MEKFTNNEGVISFIIIVLKLYYKTIKTLDYVYCAISI